MGYGTSKAVKQYFVGTYNGGTTNAVYLTPQTTINGVTEVKGNGGYSSGSGSSSSGLVYQVKNYGILASGTNLTVDTISTANTSTGPNYLIGYAGTGDAGKSSAAPLRLLQYAGATYSDAAVINGQYGFWCYEDMYYNASTSVANTVTVGNGIAANILNTPTSGLSNAGVQLSTMNVSRGSDFAVIVQTY